MVYLILLQIIFIIFSILLIVNKFVVSRFWPDQFEPGWFALFKPSNGKNTRSKSSSEILEKAENLESQAGKAKEKAKETATSEIKEAKAKIETAEKVKYKTQKRRS